MRLTNTKFFELLEKGCRLLCRGQKRYGENFFARMERCAALPSFGTVDSGRGDLYDLAKEFDHISLNDVDKDHAASIWQSCLWAGSMVARDLEQ